jgi:hypothetical protein
MSAELDFKIGQDSFYSHPCQLSNAHYIILRNLITVVVGAS